MMSLPSIYTDYLIVVSCPVYHKIKYDMQKERKVASGFS